MTSSALFEVLWYSVVIVITFAPRIRASVSQCPSGIFVAIQFMPHVVMSSACSAMKRSKSLVLLPVTMGWPGGRSVCHA
jgi:hypothetical protein